MRNITLKIIQTLLMLNIIEFTMIFRIIHYNVMFFLGYINNCLFTLAFLYFKIKLNQKKINSVIL